jgi:hypothetical protein
MMLARNNETRPAKGWYTELAHPALLFIGYANRGINERHVHREKGNAIRSMQ